MINKKFEDYYYNRLTYFSNDAQRVGWKSLEAQETRFLQLGKLIQTNQFVMNDLGCGIGCFLSFLQKHFGTEISYKGYDLLPEMIDEAKEKYGETEKTAFLKIDNITAMQEADYSVACGIFNLCYEVPEKEWLAYILETITALHQKSTKGFAFNALSKYTGADKMSESIYYADPCFLFDFCKTNFSKNVTLLHDYDFDDFTILVRKN